MAVLGEHWWKKIWLFLLICISVSFSCVAWWIASEDQRQIVEAKFNHLTAASEKALQHRMDSYFQALLGGKGFFEGSSSVSRSEWRAYTQALDLKNNFPGINGIGLILDVPKTQMQEFIQQVQLDYPTFNARPEGDHAAQYLITFIEPVEINAEAVGLNIAFEQHRREAANLANISRRAAITQRILLVQDASQTPGFLLLLPISSQHTNVDGVDFSLDGWIYAPFIAKNFMADLTQAQGRDFEIEIYDEVASAETLIYTSQPDTVKKHNSLLFNEKTVEIMQQKWLIRWSSTKAFEVNNISLTPFFVLIFGLIFSLFIGLFLFLVQPKTNRLIHKYEQKSPYALPVLLFVLFSSSAFVLYSELVKQKEDRVKTSMLNQLLSLEAAFYNQYEKTLTPLEASVNAWESQGILPGLSRSKIAALFEGYTATNQSLIALALLPDVEIFNSIFDLQNNINSVGVFYQYHEKFQPEDLIAHSFNGAFQAKLEATPKARLVSDLFEFNSKQYFMSVIPIIVGEQTKGSLLALFEVSSFMTPLINQLNPTSKYTLSLGQQGNERFYGVKPQEKGLQKGIEKVLAVDGANWVLTLEANQGYGNAYDQFLTKLILFICVAMSFLTSIVMYFSQQVRRASKIVEEKQNLLSRFVQHVPMNVAMFDEQWRYMVASRRWYEFYDLSPDIIGLKHPVEKPDWLQLNVEPDENKIRKMEGKILHKDGSLRAWMRYQVCDWQDTQGNQNGVIVFAEDITEEKNIALMKNEFISTVSHELRTPLTAIQGALGLLKMGSGQALESKYQKILNTSYENCLNLTRIVNDILDLEKMAAGHLEYNYQLCDVIETVEDAVRLNKPYAEKYAASVVLTVPNHRGFISVDIGRLKQCLANLLSNAAKFSSANGQIAVRVFFDQSCRIEVEDFGVGMSQEFQQKIFERFVQADGSTGRSEGGTGLGLAITKTMVEDMGGSIAFESIIDQGTCFCLEFNLSENKTALN